jgi:hypothetical protein
MWGDALKECASRKSSRSHTALATSLLIRTSVRRSIHTSTYITDLPDKGRECLRAGVLGYRESYLTLFVGYAGNMTVKKASQGAGFAAVAIAAAALIGWWARLPLLSSWARVFPT